MLTDALSELTARALSGPFVVVTIVFVAFVSTRIARVMIRRVIRHVAKRSLVVARRGGSMSPGSWRARARRLNGETGEVGEQRRRQRIDAAARMISHLASIVIWIAAGIAVFHLLDINPAFFLSSAGFIGAALAIGGQHKVNDYLTGLSVHFEDRYGVGDEIEIEAGWSEPVRGIVDHVGLFSTRVRDRRSTVHVPNHALVSVRNLSQEAPTTTLRVNVPDTADPEYAARLMRDMAGTDGLTDVMFLGDLAVRDAGDGQTEIDVSTRKALDGRSRDRLVRRVERVLEDQNG
ncbi:MAG: mechanosensitive ion channel domain-containing protein [Ilumatobacteraceae bacterium]